jgi:hypothetical protein
MFLIIVVLNPVPLKTHGLPARASVTYVHVRNAINRFNNFDSLDTTTVEVRSEARDAWIRSMMNINS